MILLIRVADPDPGFLISVYEMRSDTDPDFKKWSDPPFPRHYGSGKMVVLIGLREYLPPPHISKEMSCTK